MNKKIIAIRKTRHMDIDVNRDEVGHMDIDVNRNEVGHVSRTIFPTSTGTHT